MVFVLGTENPDVLGPLPTNDYYLGFGGNDTILSGAGNDIVFGGDGNDRIFGGEGDDLLIGDAGDDLLVGGLGADTLVGRAGADLFCYNNPLEGGDTIDLLPTQGDMLMLDPVSFNLVTPSGSFLQASEFSTSLGAVTANTRIIVDNSVIYSDLDGNGSLAPTVIANLGSGITLSNTDIIVN